MRAAPARRGASAAACALLGALLLAAGAGAPRAQGPPDGAPGDTTLTLFLGGADDAARFVVVDPAAARPPDAAGRTPLGGGAIERRRVAASASGPARVVAVWVVPLEAYLVGVVGAEMGADAPPAALAAQAIASRTLGLRAVRAPMRRDVGAMLDLTERTQAYDWRRGASSAAVRGAVAATAGAYLAEPDGRAALTPFHACCGGHTSLASVAWPASTDPPYLAAAWRTERPRRTALRLGAVEDLRADEAARRWHADLAADGWCAPGHDGIPAYARESFRWTRELDAATAAAARVGAWRAVARGPGGHLGALATGAGEPLRGDLAIRDVVAPRLPSANFSWTLRPDGTAELRGAGRGHGVGMCQLCARGMAAQGFDAPAILAEFFGEPVALRGGSGGGGEAGDDAAGEE